MSALPHDLQGRLDVILAKPVLRRAPTLAASIAMLVRNAYDRQPSQAIPAAEHQSSFSACSCYLCTTARNLLAGSPLPALEEIRKAAGEQKDGVL